MVIRKKPTYAALEELYRVIKETCTAQVYVKEIKNAEIIGKEKKNNVNL